MSILRINGTFSPAVLFDFNILGTGTRHNVSVTWAIPAHLYTSAMLIAKWHVAGPYVNFFTYLLVLRVDANVFHTPGQAAPLHGWMQATGGPYPGAALEDDLVLSGAMRGAINTAAGGNMTWLLDLDSPLQVPRPSSVVLDSAQLVLTYSDTPEGSFAKRWSAALVDGRGICCFVDVDNKLYVSTARDLKRQIAPSNGAHWGTAYSIDDHAADCNVGIHPHKGRAQIWYTKLDASNLNPHSAYVTSPTAGASQDWSAPTLISGSAFTQPYTPVSSHFVSSQSTGLGADVCAFGKDNRLCLTPNSIYQGLVNTALSSAGNAFVCTDDGIGTTWAWREVDASGVHNSQDGAQKAMAQDADSTFLGKTRTQITVPDAYPGTGPVLGRSGLVLADNGTWYQLLFTKRYTRLAKMRPRTGSPTAAAGGNTFTNNVNNAPPVGTSLTNNYTLDVPAGSDSMRYLRLNWQLQKRERAPLVGTLNNANKPKSLRFDIPALLDIPPYDDLGSPSIPYGGSSYLSAYIQWDIVYTGAKGLQIALTHDATLGGAGVKYPTAQQAKTIVLEGRGEFTGTAGWDFYGNFDIDRARSSTIIFDVLINGTYDSLTFKSAKLHIHNAQTETVDILTLATAMPMSTAGSVGGLIGIPPEFFVDLAYPITGVSLFCPTSTPLMDEVNSRQGDTWEFDLTWTQLTNTLGSGGSNKVLPFDDLMTAQYAQCFYQANQVDATLGDFFVVRSRDNGLTWEFAGEGARIAGLSLLRDWNNGPGNDVKMPSLLTERNIVYAVWVDQNKVYSVASQDAGDTWTGISEGTGGLSTDMITTTEASVTAAHPGYAALTNGDPGMTNFVYSPDGDYVLVPL